jgi:hypothetical protein
MQRRYITIGVMLSNQEMKVIEKKAEEEGMTKHSYLNKIIFNYIKENYITDTPKMQYLRGRTQYTLRVPYYRWIILDNIQKYNGVKLKKTELVRYVLIEALKKEGVDFDKPKRMMPVSHCSQCCFLNEHSNYMDCIATKETSHIENPYNEVPEWCPLPIYPIAI